MSEEILEVPATPAGDPPVTPAVPATGDPSVGEGLEKALRAERDARKVAERRLRELERTAAAGTKTVEERIAAIEAERDALRRERAVREVVRERAAALKGYDVDADFVASLALRLSVPDDDLAGEVDALIERMKRPTAGAKPAAVGTPNAEQTAPTRKASDYTHAELVVLERENPEAAATVWAERHRAMRFGNQTI